MRRAASVIVIAASLASSRAAARPDVDMGTWSQQKVQVETGVRIVAHIEGGGGSDVPDLRPELQRQVAASTKTVTSAYAFFVKGKHPFKRYLRYLDQVARPEPDSYARTDGGPRSQVIELAGVQVELFVTADAPREVRDKLAFDFVLAQAWNRGFFAIEPYAHDATFDPLAAAYAGSYYTMPQTTLARLIAFATLHPREWAALLAAKDDGEPGSQRAYEHRAARARLRVLDRVLRDQAIGTAMIEEAAATWEPQGNLTFLLFVSSDRDRDQHAAIAAAFANPEIVKVFGALLR